MKKALLATLSFSLLIAISSLANAGSTQNKILPENLDTECFSRTEKAELEEKINFYIEDSYVQCDKSNLGYRVYKALLLMKKMGPLDDDNPYDQIRIGSPFEFFSDRVTDIVTRGDDNSNCSADPGHSAVAYASGPNTISICPIAMKQTDLELIGTLLHEARHAGADAPGKVYGSREAMHVHVICLRGFNKGFYGCDKQMIDDGAYAVSVNSSLGFSRDESLSPALRQESRSSATADIIRRFNTISDGVDRGHLFVRSNGAVDFYDGRTTTKILSTPADFMFVAASPGNLNVLQFDTLLTAVYNFNPELPKEFKNYYYANQVPDDEMKNVVDAVSVNDYQCLLLFDAVKCWPRADSSNLHTISLPADGSAIGFFVRPKTVEDPNDTSEKYDAFIVKGQSGVPNRRSTAAMKLPETWADFQSQIDRKQILFPSSDQFDQMVRKYIDIVRMPPGSPASLRNGILQLDRASGKLSVQLPNTKDRRGHVVPGMMFTPSGINLPGVRTKRIVSDFYWGQQLELL